jgi:hypothetical protein
VFASRAGDARLIRRPVEAIPGRFTSWFASPAVRSAIGCVAGATAAMAEDGTFAEYAIPESDLQRRFIDPIEHKRRRPEEGDVQPDVAVPPAEDRGHSQMD